MLIDEVDITVRAGHGGPGKVSFGANGADGGNGGKGGNVILRVTSDLKALNQFSAEKNIVAPDGIGGAKHRSHGKQGQDVVLHLPLGCTLTEKTTGEVIELDSLDREVVVCKGGLGGRGNLEFKSSKNRTPEYAQPGLAGEYKEFHVILRYIADFGLIGLPNAGKSSLINELTNAHAAIGAYPFTTLEANLGVFGSKVIADIPGLIEGASAGKGLGTRFLKHIEKVRMLLHCISLESSDVLADFHTIDAELAAYSPDLAHKPRVILLTKSDLADDKLIREKTIELSSTGFPIYPISIHDLDSIARLKSILTS